MIQIKKITFLKGSILSFYMGSGKRSNKKRKHTFSLGGFKEKKEKVKIDQKDLDALVELWKNSKKL